MNNHSKEDLFAKSLDMINELNYELENSEFINIGLRLELVSQCIQISFEHSIGVNHLLSSELPLQAMILYRAQFKAVVKSYWILFLAKNEQLSKLNFNWTFEEQLQSDNYPMIKEMLDLLLKANLPAKPIIQQFCEFQKYNLKQLNSFVHTGKQAFTRNLIGFDNRMMITLMRQSNNLVSAAAQIMLQHSNNPKFIHTLTEKYRECFFLEEDEDPMLRARINSYLK